MLQAIEREEILPAICLRDPPCLAITTRRFWDEQHRIPEMGEWERRYFPEEVAAMRHVIHELRLAEIIEGVYEFSASTPGGKARQEKAMTLYQEKKHDALRALHEEIVELDLKPALEKLGAAESTEINKQLQGGYFSEE